MLSEVSKMEKLKLERRRLLERELSLVVERLKTEYAPKQIILFGSLAKGDTHEWSDIDLVIIKDTDKEFLDRLEEAVLIAKPEVGINLLVYTPEEFKEMIEEGNHFITEEIVEKGKVLYIEQEEKISKMA